MLRRTVLNSIAAKTIWERRRSITWWTLGMIALAALTIAFVPSVRNDAQSFVDLYDSLPKGLLSVFGIDDAAALVTPAGLVNSRVYTGIGPVIMAVFGIGVGTAAVAGEEDRGTLNLLLALPVSRTRLVLEKFAAAVVLTLIICTGILATLVVANPIVDLGFSASNMIAANIGLASVTLVFVGLSLALGAATGRRGLTIGVSAALTVAAFFVNGLAALVDGLGWAQKLTPFYWLQGPNRLANGFSPGYTSVALAVTAVFVALAVLGLNRRDIGV